MSRLEIFKNSSVDEKTLKDIVALKSQYWHYSEDSQIEWIKSNLEKDDLHFCLYDGETLVSYLNLVGVTAECDGCVFCFSGVGNVCTDKGYANKGFGAKLMAEVGKHLAAENGAGLLLCHAALVGFYEKSGWKDITGLFSQINIASNSYNHRIMCYNFSAEKKYYILNISKNF